MRPKPLAGTLVGVVRMRSLLAAVFASLAAPSAAHAAVTITMREVPLQNQRSLAAAAPVRFDLVGLHWQGSGWVSFRTESLAGRWSPWHSAAAEAEDQPDAGTAESAASRGWRLGSPYWTGASDRIAYRTHGRVSRLRAYFVWSPVDGLPPRTLSIAGSPQIISRAAWGADEAIRRAPPQYAPALRFAVVHHTAGTNSYSRADSAAIVRGIEVYHVKANGWNDIGYNFLVDKYGQIFEGRYGGIDQNVIGAHAQGFNTGSVGVAVIGTYSASAPPVAAQTALVNLLAWRLDIAHVNPTSEVMVTSGGNAKYPAGTPVLLRAVSGHRDTGFTTCPGNALYARLNAIAARVAATGLPKLYSPSVTGSLGGLVRFRATLTSALPWTVTVNDSTGETVASGSGTGTAVDWTWDATQAVQGKYTWTISAGDTVQPATGTIGSAPVPLQIKSVSAKPPSISPNGDGVADQTTVSYTLTAAATVTATLARTDGTVVATLFSERRSAGKSTFTVDADNVPDGHYLIVLDAVAGKTNVTADVPLLVDRTIAKLVVSPAAISPNGDGRNDTLTISFQLAAPAAVRVSISQASKTVADVFDGTLSPGPQSYVWNGTSSGQRARDGVYAAVVTTTTELGATQHSVLFRIDTVRPTLRAISFRRLIFNVSEAARITLVVNGRRYVRTVRAGTFSFRVGRPVRRASVVAVDAAGNVSRTLRFP